MLEFIGLGLHADRRRREAAVLPGNGLRLVKARLGHGQGRRIAERFAHQGRQLRVAEILPPGLFGNGFNGVCLLCRAVLGGEGGGLRDRGAGAQGQDGEHCRGGKGGAVVMGSREFHDGVFGGGLLK